MLCMTGYFSPLKSAFFALLAATFFQGAEGSEPAPPANPLPVLYPFVRDGKWGYIDESGKWAIEPKFDECHYLFTGDRVMAGWHGKWGYIDRSGKWIVPPRYDFMFGLNNNGFEIVSIGDKCGLLARSGKLVLPVAYDGITPLEDRAWVRLGGKIGLHAFDGHWILKPSIPWSEKDPMPVSTVPGVTWFEHHGKWGLYSNTGKLLFDFQFDEHELGRHESEDWTHPEGLDFANGRAFAAKNGKYWLITDRGEVLARVDCVYMSQWSEGMYMAQLHSAKVILIDRNGKTVFGLVSDIGEFHDGIALVRDDCQEAGREFHRFCYLNSKGETVVPFGKYSQCEAFSEGMAAVYDAEQGAGFINTSGEEVIPLKYAWAQSFVHGFAAVRVDHQLRVRSTDGWALIDKSGRELTAPVYRQIGAWSEGLIPVEILKEGETGNSYQDYLWGYIDEKGTPVIPPQFGAVTPFCRGRAWVLKDGGEWDRAQYAMIDTTGKVLTDYAYDLPERKSTWSDGELYFDHGINENTNDNDFFNKLRWRGDLAVINKGEFLNGLCTADGKVLIEPIYNVINEFHDGIAIAMDSRQHDAKGNVTFVTRLLTSRGETLADRTYTSISKFRRGHAWAARWIDGHGGAAHYEGWALIDTSAHEICEPKYTNADWVFTENGNSVPGGCPIYSGELAAVALATGAKSSVKNPSEQSSWGYIDRAGKIVAWHEKERGK